MMLVRLALGAALAVALATAADDPGFLLSSGDYRWVPLHIGQSPTRVDVSFQVQTGDGTVHAEIVPEAAFRPMQRGQAHEALAATASGMSGTLQQTIDMPGVYRVVIANKNGAKPAFVTWRVSTESNPEPTATELSPKRRMVTIAVSFLLFFAMVGLSGWKLRKSAEG